MVVQSNGIRVLAVDDDRAMLDFISGQLGARGFLVETALSGGEAIELAGRRSFDLVICDLKMPLMDGIACMEALTRQDPALQVIIVSGEATVDKAVTAMKKGAYDFLQKPLRMEDLFCLIEKLILKRQLDSVIGVYEKSCGILSHFDAKELLGPALRNALAFFGAERACWITAESPGLQISYRCGPPEDGPYEDMVELARAAVRDSAHPSGISETALWVTLMDEGRVIAVFVLKRPATSPAFLTSELREASNFAKRLLEIVGASRLRRSLDNNLEALRKAHGELEKTKGLLAHKEKLAELGGLVACMAHEINNPLTCVLGYASMLRDKEKNVSSKERLSLIVSEAERCQRMTRDILSYARVAKPCFRWLQIQTLVSETLQILAPELKKEGVRIQVDSPPSKTVGFSGDPDQLKQVLINLLKNALHATRGRSDRRIIVGIGGNSESVRLTVKDNGHGISPENLKKIFEPYFSTKSNGEGTGLGLSLTNDIIRTHHGRLSVHSIYGEGATFVVELPVCQPDFDASLDHAA